MQVLRGIVALDKGGNVVLIDHIRVKNFKSIKEIDMDLSPLTLIVGANASGKSNLINVFRFISNIMTSGIDNAIALQGGVTYLANASLPKGTPIEIEFSVDLSDEGWIRTSDVKNFGYKVEKIQYHFIIQPNKRGNGYHIESDNLKVNCNCMQVNPMAKKDDRYTDLDQKLLFCFTRKSRSSKIQSSFKFERNKLSEEQQRSIINDTAAYFFKRIANEDRSELMLYRISLLFPPVFSDEMFIRIFDFDPRELKKSSSMASVRRLNEDGSNLASVLQSILRVKENRRKLTILLKDFLPFINGLTVENNVDKSVSYKIQEQFSNKSFHASFLSDGTVSILAIIVALYFENESNVVILEEPERNIHPKLLSNLLSSAEDISNEKQIIITTHNPELLKHSKLETVRLITRDKDGFSKISSPIDNEMVNCFIKNDLGLDELFIQNLLGD